ncbi:Uma2 family endonuclease [Butyrivibrio sp. WCD2001]|uniref:Uma2 family endonuclease n=1 Tax=Butyrivibrio sp. WCD2001 TaxID=1280681 RepID=UPI00041FB071|nr:Uma2 family endonuclease [Butyrivibrio sp. WCD2001]
MEKHAKEDYYNTPKYALIELIDGDFYQRVHPGIAHQDLLGEIMCQIMDKCDQSAGKLHMMPGPVALELGKRTIVEPDLMIFTDRKIIAERCIVKVPDLIMEITSPEDLYHDYVTKLKLYMDANVKEYWLINPEKRTAVIYCFEEDNTHVDVFEFDTTIYSRMFPEICLEIADWNVDYLNKS